MRPTPFYVALYLAAIVAANLSVAHFGPGAVVFNAFLFIGLDLTCRDGLHDLFGNHRAVKMGALIMAGSGLSYALNAHAGTIALASCVSFAAAATVDAVVYQLRHSAPWFQRANESNVISAAVDSVVSPALAFPGPLALGIVFGQFTAKIAGGFVWSLALQRRRRVRVLDLGTDEGALEAVQLGVLAPHEAPLAVLRDLQKRQGR